LLHHVLQLLSSGGHHSQDGSTYLNYKLSYLASICIFFTPKRTNWLCTCSSSPTFRTLHMLSNCYLRSLVLINNAYCHLFKTTPCIAPSFRLNLFQKFNQKSAEILDSLINSRIDLDKGVEVPTYLNLNIVHGPEL
jgi:hypothetical protein